MTNATSVLKLSNLPKSIRAEVKRATASMRAYHGLVVKGYSLKHSYYDGTPRVLVSLVGRDRFGNSLEHGWMIEELYSGKRGVSASEFEALWEAAGQVCYWRAYS